VPVIAFLATDDPLVPYEGGEISAILGFVKRGKVTSADEIKRFWLNRNGCDTSPTIERLPDRTPADNSTVLRESYSLCQEGADVVFYRLEGSGHTWPGGKQYLSPLLVGTTNRDVDATELIWQFFAAHPMR
jgi:polyhydroxybutyrate depolymerase